LIGALSTGVGEVIRAEDGLAGLGQSGDTDSRIEVEAADNCDLGHRTRLPQPPIRRLAALAIEIHTVEMHTGGEPVRIVTSGLPPIDGDTILAKRRFAQRHLDDLRRLLMHEPRGHADMYGVFPVTPDDPQADLGALFTHNEGYSTMCGHATIALGRWAVDTGVVPRIEPVTSLAIQVPAGLIRLEVDTTGPTAGTVRFRSVPAFTIAIDHPIHIDGHGPVPVDVAYGGAFYAFADAAHFGLDVRNSTTSDLVDAAWAVTNAVRGTVPLHHPDDPDLEFLYGTLLTDGADAWSTTPTVNICVFADREVDRSPTGSGVTARIAIQRTKGLIAMNASRRFESVTGQQFTGSAVESTRLGDHEAWVVEVAGRSYYTGESLFTLEDDDPLPSFLLS
jgi:proline racemase